MGSSAFVIAASGSGTLESLVAVLLVAGMFWGFYVVFETPYEEG